MKLSGVFLIAIIFIHVSEINDLHLVLFSHVHNKFHLCAIDMTANSIRERWTCDRVRKDRERKDRERGQRLRSARK